MRRDWVVEFYFDNDHGKQSFLAKEVLKLQTEIFYLHCSQLGWHLIASHTRSPGEPQASRKRISNKVVVIILLLCVVLTTLAFLSSLGCYIYQRDKYPVQPPVLSSDKDTSCNSTTNLISHKSTSVPEFKVNIDSPVNSITGKIIVIWSNFALVLKPMSILEDWRSFVPTDRTDSKTPPLSCTHVVPLLGYCSESQGKHAERLLITDLGVAKRLRTDDLPSCSSSPARMQDTFGYLAPEYVIVGRASLKSDATPRLQDSRRVISELPDLLLEGNFPEEEMQIMAYLVKECLLLDPGSRLTMSEVVQILSTIAT
ncbi:hypothetical protein HHK36_019182 [Tetracentron sinense]|uniref:Protein kinase domain-containing protein n=1 Tax=Tetracentron sinense TaxID=13715 RepID=A0A834YVT4_TETSI|nr:hypothetical protein HHK36_019182 [Tetracentron sinense]